MRIPSGKVDQSIYFVAVDSSDLTTRKTGLAAFTVYRSRNGAAGVVYTTPTVVEVSAANMPGVYALLIDEDTTIAAGSNSEEYCVHITCATMAPVSRSFELYRHEMDIPSGIETGYTLKQAVRAMAAVLAGKSSGHPGSPVYRSLDDSANRVTGTVSAGNRTVITLNV